MSNTFRASEKATPDRSGAIPDRPPSCVLTLDGGIPGTTEFSQLLIIERIVNDLQFRRDDDGELSDESEGNSETDRQLRPCDIFDYIAGSGTGGFFAILFEYFQYSVTEAKAFYYKLYKQVFAAPSWVQKGKENTRRILEDSLKSLLPLGTLNKLLVKKGKSRQCRAFICAVNPNNNASPRLFRSGHRFSNLTSRCMQEIQALEGDDRPLSCIVSVGVGAPGPLLEGDPRAILRDSRSPHIQTSILKWWKFETLSISSAKIFIGVPVCVLSVMNLLY
ncbi:hypothetical protein DL96DRAFT_1675071 [Flagelloscypha sp. PMI_526]|nr:hypothetical protein DL96DRAFT_1675071 [Flagelloscypha sp. PMI_526]